jgi:DNA mismatch repair protein MutS
MIVKNVNSNIIFVRKLTRGNAERSFGVNVAKLAGMPPSIISRAQKIMRSLQNGELKFEIQKSEEEINNDKKLDNIKKFFNNLNVNDITPLEALNKLNELKILINNL